VHSETNDNLKTHATVLYMQIVHSETVLWVARKWDAGFCTEI